MFPKKIVIFVAIVILCIISGLLGWASYRNYNDFHGQLFESGVSYLNRVRDDIHKGIEEHKTKTQLFVNSEKALITRLIAQELPEDLQHLEQQINRHFPENHGFAIVSPDGKPLMGSSIDTLTEAELQDFKRFIEQGQQQFQ